MSSTRCNYVINVKPYWGCCVWIMIIFVLVAKIDTYKVGKAPQYTFSVWKCMIIMMIFSHFRLCHIRCFGINMTPIWNDCIFYVSYMWCAFSPDLLLWSFFIWYLSFFQIPITLGKQLWMYTFSRNPTFTTTNDLILCWYLL